MKDYPKLSQTYYVLLECLAQDHMAFLATMEPQVFLYILSSISEGLTALGGNLNYFTGTRGGRQNRKLRLNVDDFMVLWFYVMYRVTSSILQGA